MARTTSVLVLVLASCAARQPTSAPPTEPAPMSEPDPARAAKIPWKDPATKEYSCILEPDADCCKGAPIETAAKSAPSG